MESVGLLIALVLVKQLWGHSSVTSCFSSVCELSTLRMEISISIKTLSLQKRIHTTETQTWFYSVIRQLKVAGAVFLPKDLSDVCSCQFSAGIWAVVCSSWEWVLWRWLHWRHQQEECQWLSKALKM